MRFDTFHLDLSISLILLIKNDFSSANTHTPTKCQKCRNLFAIWKVTEILQNTNLVNFFFASSHLLFTFLNLGFCGSTRYEVKHCVHCKSPSSLGISKYRIPPQIILPMERTVIGRRHVKLDYSKNEINSVKT